MIPPAAVSLTELDLSKPACGIYFLIKKSTVVYVGQSINVLARLASHQQQKVGEFDRVMVLLAEREKLNDLELEYIRTLRPRLNIQGMAGLRDSDPDDTKYLQKRHRTWYVVVRVPDSLYSAMHRRHVVRTLKTHSLAEAQALRWPIVREIKQQLRAA